MITLLILLWLVAGLAGVLLVYANEVFSKRELRRKYPSAFTQNDLYVSPYPSPLGIVVLAVLTFLGPAILLFAVLISVAQYGIWYWRGKFAWLTTPIREKRKP